MKGLTISLATGSDHNLTPVKPSSVTGGTLLTSTSTTAGTTTFVLNPAVQVTTAPAGSPTPGTFSGTGTNALAFGSVTLNVPVGIAQIGTYTGNIVWDLTTAP